MLIYLWYQVKHIEDEEEKKKNLDIVINKKKLKKYVYFCTLL